MLINLRNALMGGKRLPYDAEVEYLECAGTSSVFPYIDTGIVGSMDVTVSARIWKSTKAMNECAMGSWDRGNTRCWPLYFNSNKYYLGMGPLASMLTEVTSEVWHDIALTKSGNTFIYTADGTVVGQASSTSTFASARTLYIGAMNDTGNPFYYFRGRFAFVKIYQNGVLVRDFIPVRKGTVGYLYDRVSGKLFGNAGTGDFVLGPDVVPVEYIESHGTEWINTRIKPTDSNGIKIEFLPIANASTNNIFGVYSRASSIAFRFTCDTSTASATGGSYWWNARISIANPSPWYNNKSTVSLNFLNDRKFIIDGITSYNVSGTLDAMNHTLSILAVNTPAGALSPASARLYQCLISDGNATILHNKPVRVGTEGAMMDVLTRRIYRNAGTGAFTYGNDLKYPIPAS